MEMDKNSKIKKEFDEVFLPPALSLFLLMFILLNSDCFFPVDSFAENLKRGRDECKHIIKIAKKCAKKFSSSESVTNKD